MHHYRINKGRLTTYKKLAASLKEQFCLTEYAVAAALSALGYNPAIETLQAFNECFNAISESGVDPLP